jgi:hypothetical protein
MAETRLLAEKFTPTFLMDLCDGLTGLQAFDTLQPFIGQWMRFSGPLLHATPNPEFGTVGVTVDLSDAQKRRDAFLLFTRDMERLVGVYPGDVITAEGRIKSITSHSMTLDHCGLTDPQTVAIRELVARYEERRAKEPPVEARATTDTDPTEEDLPKVDFEHLKLWHLAFEAAHPNGSEELAIKSARGAFPNNFVPRQWVRDLRGERPKGRPRKNKGK